MPQFEVHYYLMGGAGPFLTETVEAQTLDEATEKAEARLMAPSLSVNEGDGHRTVYRSAAVSRFTVAEPGVDPDAVRHAPSV